jgi:hypothetical protein
MQFATNSPKPPHHLVVERNSFGLVLDFIFGF